MANFTQAVVADAIAHQHITHPNSVYGADITPTAGSLWATVHMSHALIEATANTNPGSFYVQTSLEGAGVEDAWVTVAQFTVSNATPGDEALDAQEVAGTAVIAVTLTAGFVADDVIYITDDTADNNSEWHKIDKVVTDTSIDLVDDLDFQKEIGDVIFSDAEHFSMKLDLSGVTKWRVIYKAEGATGADVAVRARYIEVTDFE